MNIKFHKNNIWVNIGAGLSILMILYCFVYIFNYYRHNDILWHYPRNVKYEGSKLQNLSPNEIGDSIGGILNPIIGMVASILTFLAFYMQKRANDDIQAQFKVQQFESQFYEMLRLHKENVNEIEIVKDDNTSIKGRMAFHHAVLDFHSVLQNIIPTTSFVVGIFDLHRSNLSPSEIEDAKFHQLLNFAYRIFFWDNATNPPEYIIDDDHSTIHSFSITASIYNRRNNNWHASLGHYYRHLFLLVKFVVNNHALDYNSKMAYLKIVRAQLSNYEQIMLFYNWFAEGYGSSWEEGGENGNKFFTRYKMIHNLWYDELYPDNFLYRKINDLIDTYNLDPKDTPLFEFQGNNFSYKIPVPDNNKPLSENF